jgi:hypothetical protein
MNDLARVARATNQAEAEFVQSLLLDAGIPSMLRRSRGFDVPDMLAAGSRRRTPLNRREPSFHPAPTSRRAAGARRRGSNRRDRPREAPPLANGNGRDRQRDDRLVLSEHVVSVSRDARSSRGAAHSRWRAVRRAVLRFVRGPPPMSESPTDP